MNGEIGTEAAPFLFWEYVNGIFVAVYHLVRLSSQSRHLSHYLFVIYSIRLNYICTCCLYGDGLKDFDVGKSITRAIERGGS
jgi:hypothetical protein